MEFSRIYKWAINAQIWESIAKCDYHMYVASYWIGLKNAIFVNKFAFSWATMRGEREMNIYFKYFERKRQREKRKEKERKRKEEKKRKRRKERRPRKRGRKSRCCYCRVPPHAAFIATGCYRRCRRRRRSHCSWSRFVSVSVSDIIFVRYFIFDLLNSIWTFF